MKPTVVREIFSGEKKDIHRSKHVYVVCRHTATERAVGLINRTPDARIACGRANSGGSRRPIAYCAGRLRRRRYLPTQYTPGNRCYGRGTSAHARSRSRAPISRPRRKGGAVVAVARRRVCDTFFGANVLPYRCACVRVL